MKTIASQLLWLLLACSGLMASNIPNTYTVMKVETYEPPKIPKSALLTFVGMDFSSSRILNEYVLADLHSAPIYQIDLVYTRFPEGTAVEQFQLNERRINNLVAKLPRIADGPGIQWRWVEQTDCRNLKEASSLFHGFVIVHGPPSDLFSEASSMQFEERVAKAVAIGKADVKVDSTARWMMTPRQFEKYVKEHNLLDDVFTRNAKWKHKLIVQDVTGSMMPYYEQLMIWHALRGTERNVEGYLFFNDGDHRPDGKKVVGKTGGLYYTEEQEMQKVMSTLLVATMAGGGGDTPENDIEAVLEGIHRCPKAKEIILIADNWATPRDLVLLSEVGKPIRVVLCGAYLGINPAYLDVARRTGGSIHTVEEDLENLMLLKEGEVVELGDQHFRLKGGKFVAI